MLSLISILTLALAGAMSAPTYPNSNALRPRNIGGVYFCDLPFWPLPCEYSVYPLNTCITLGADWDKRISAIGPDNHTSVIAFTNAGCTGTANAAFVFPGNDNLSTIDLDNAISSFIVLSY
ncbi:hypothetical protein M422DRAFT_25969 [Sphaerobolus stellatus SS14]|nr:hypothetical protein M422DRAFT_25969 [Sphaerobolus stellatus SS14]